MVDLFAWRGTIACRFCPGKKKGAVNDSTGRKKILIFDKGVNAPETGGCPTILDRLQTQLPGPDFSAFSADSYGYELSNAPKFVLNLLGFRFGPYSRTASWGRFSQTMERQAA